MEIGSVPYYAFPSIGYAINASQSGRMSVPVSQSSYIYAQFKHVSGVPASDGVSGVNIDKLLIIDALIEQVTRMKKQPEPAFDMIEQDGEERIDALIEHYQNQIMTAQAANANTPYAPAAPLTGMVFNISV
ncbi:MAG: hypothetical protein FWH38_10315 [Treponema sp.]|nr:hypothetical protein [Treponema sp.]